MPSARAGKRKKPVSVTAGRGTSPWMIVGVVVLVLFAGGVGFGVYQAQSAAGQVNIPAGGTETGIVIGQESARATVDLYVDFQCPACKAFEEQVGPTLDQLVAEGQAKVIYHPVAYLNRFSGGTEYSTRSSQASACAADAGIFPAFARALFAQQPPEGGTGLPDEQLVAIGRDAGAGDEFARCVEEERYAGWTSSVTESASRDGINSTPTLKVNGVETTRSPEALVAAVQAAQG